MTNFKGTKGKWSVYYNEYGHITSVRSVEANRTVFTSKVNNMNESNSNMILAQHAPEMLEMLESLINESDDIIHLEIKKDILNLIKKATDE